RVVRRHAGHAVGEGERFPEVGVGAGARLLFTEDALVQALGDLVLLVPRRGRDAVDWDRAVRAGQRRVGRPGPAAAAGERVGEGAAAVGRIAGDRLVLTSGAAEAHHVGRVGGGLRAAQAA